ncbi:putative bifunctional diguanylate cyclase/phosphodiesterase [Candidatus Nitrotoga sp. 1052]|uniref:putative bifunctional diguanylate cyclase/phosphodiesterase n=1 Tax=Candidatus Nitrotoga sp. 1052 TaxID=2886964 RepID=UPI001EF4396E|nr:GGDEF domain-containing phosphodiesterase [Candidatus Nitrotoga sp. 1052]CAH1091433.1 EAL domain, c-di-GMP-specific phosphodiesterase class I (Or its enzymatically inactive variant) [Candidatus Nitrotoga sp. 1052]
MIGHSPPPPHQSTTTATQHQLTHNQLVNFLRDEIGKTEASATAVLIMKLRRTKRLDAIIGDTSTQSIINYTDQRLDSLLRDADRYAHFSDEQICLVLSGLANNAQSILAATKILSELHKPFIADDSPVMLRPHIGIANFPELGRDAGQLLMYADIASDIAATNEQGYYVYQPEDRIETEAYSGLDIELGHAIKANELHVHYQPQVNIQTGRCVSIEALVRWTAPGQRVIDPSTLIGIAENAGLINTLTLWILNTALRHTAAFLKAGIDIGISVNLPPKMLEDKELPQIVQQALDMWGIPASNLTLEITESLIIDDYESSLTMLSRLRELGIRLSIDDFGTGYSSLAYVKHFPVQELKIDILFIQNIHKSREDKHLVRTIIDLAKNFNLITVAEGVEDQETFDLLRDLGCDLVQGFLYSRALSDTDFISWYRQRT